MKLILFRHGIALDRDLAIQKNLPDELRPLTDEGRKKTLQVVKALKKLEPELDMLVSSPLKRAMQTAELLAETYSIKTIHQSPELVPAAPPMAFCNWLNTQTDSAKVIAAVGHEPQMSVLASWLLAGQTDSFIEFKKSGLICLEFESFEGLAPRTAQLRWLLSPKLISQLK